MKKINVKTILSPILSLAIICAVATALLAYTNRVTAPMIVKIEAEKEAASRRVVLSDAASFEDKTIEVDDITYSYCVGLAENGKVVGYVFTSSQNGYGGEVSVMIGRDTKGCITAIEVLNCSEETPGLGQNSKTPQFKERFNGIDGMVEIIKNGTPSSSQVQAITGATITSKAVASAVNDTLSLYQAITGGENNG